MKPVASACLRPPERQALLVSGRAASAQRAGAATGRFLRLSDDALHNPRLSPRERVRHTRFSALAHGLASDCAEGLGDTLDRQRTGIVTASTYGCIEVTNATREAYRAGGVMGVDPVQFSKATHSYLANALSIAFGWRGPVSSLLGRRDTTLEAVWLASSLIEQRLADAMFVIVYDELGECAQRHLAATPADAEGPPVGEACAVLTLVASDRPRRTPGWALNRPRADAAVPEGARALDAYAHPDGIDYLSANPALHLIRWMQHDTAPALDLLGEVDGRQQRLRLQHTEARP